MENILAEHTINHNDNFIMGWYHSDTSLCDEIVSYHSNNPDTFSGIIGNGVNHNIKKSTDCKLNDPLLRYRYLMEYLNPCTQQYTARYPYCNYYSPWRVVEPINVQHYQPGEAFYGWHTERTDNDVVAGARHLVFMTYLNDVTDEGETEFLHQKIKIRPEKGLTLIWGADWTFTHRGIPSPTQNKYIVTGWFNFTSQ